ncbi:MAG: hypothetical protein DWQ47_12235 [Acidobacteria bacterium]|nr:MAG: hypothetical protein DWQ32_14650 [Acidobacteriota bacterium]REJ98337.1 MAG: hypothetical protein DWQ38_17450 [Acidobacteriota bacterium]REK17081.1 MAG: hypothetical protein DWQ43_02495 [Acidobacteriota bacterium]REK42991.1 MAG: hypothetical protein DWQ47_12235 [Acidobacteriota bacterium]
MITLEGPHMGLNDSRSTNRVQMWNTWNVTTTETVEHMLGWIAEVARGAPGGKLKNLVFRCHGAPAYLQCGEGIRRSDTGLFSALSGLVDKIWFSACQVGYITPGTGGNPGPASGDGNMFCSEIARAANCYVVAGTELQVIGVNRTLPYGCLDTYEGLVLSYGPSGTVTWSRRYPSTYNRGSSGWARNPD